MLSPLFDSQDVGNAEHFITTVGNGIYIGIFIYLWTVVWNQIACVVILWNILWYTGRNWETSAVSTGIVCTMTVL